MVRERSTQFYSQANFFIVICGLVGLALAVYILLGFTKETHSRFHEIQFGPQEVTGPFLNTLKIRYSDRLKQLEHYRDSLRRKGKTDTSGLIGGGRIDTLRARLDRITERQFQWEFGNRDTAFDTNIHYSLSRNNLYQGLSHFKDTDTLLVGYFDPQISPDTARYYSVAKLNKYPSTIEFFSKYPSFALWIFLGLAQMVAWFLAMPICIAIYNLIGDALDLRPFYKNKDWVKSAVLAGGVVGCFCLVLYKFIVYRSVVRDVYFMDGFEDGVVWYALVGYVVSALSFTGYLYIANTIYQLQKDFRAGTVRAKNLKAAEPAAAVAPAVVPAEGGADAAAVAVVVPPADEAAIAPATGGSLQVQEDANEKLRRQYRIARKYFAIYFYITAGVLSLVTLWIGTLFSAVNSMDVMRYYRYLSGNTFLPNDFVYLFGGLHSLLLLIFFLPVELNMFNLNSLIPELENRDADRSWGGLLKNVASSVGNLLVVSSPILASILHGILSSNASH